MRPHYYRIIVSGRLGEAGHVAFEDLRIEPCGADTALIGKLDLPGLRSVLDRVLGLGLELVELSRLTDEAAEAGEAAETGRRPRNGRHTGG